MISRKHRFRGYRSLDYVYRHGKGFRTDGIGIKVSPSKKEDYRLAVVVSKKVHKSAVKRNRIRRRVFEQFRQIRKSNGQPIKYDIIITAFKDDLAIMPADKLANSCKKLLTGVGIKT